jgi:hypothetical protein
MDSLGIGCNGACACVEMDEQAMGALAAAMATIEKNRAW